MSSTHDHSHGVARIDPARYKVSRHVTWVSVVVNVTLTIAQVTVGVIGHSQALVADGMHTLSDLITDGMVLFALKHGAKEPDAEHPYGHRRVETAMTLMLGTLLLVVGAGIALRAGMRLLDPALLIVPAAVTLWIAVLTLVAKEGLYRYLMRTAERFDSDLLRANAWHSRSDAVSSLVVVAGIAGSLYGFGYLDAVAAIIVAIMIAKMGVEFGWRALRELIDTGLGATELDTVRATIDAVSGVRSSHNLRTRRVGGQTLVDVHVIVDSRLSVSEGARIGETVRQHLIAEIDSVADVLVHVDAEADAHGPSAGNLPARVEALARLQRYFETIPEARAIERTTLHYLNGRIDVELLLPLTTIADPGQARALADRFAATVRHDLDIGRIEILFR